MPASHPPPADLSPRAALAPAPAPRVWRIYRITRCRDGRGYVGVTCRSLAGRAAAHRHHARRHPDLGRPGSLAAAIRAALAEGLGFAEAFRIEELDSTPDPAAARALERHWIARLGTAWPEGFNRAPGGASLGGPANAVPVTLHHPRRGVRRYPSLLAAIAAIEAERRAAGRPPLPPGVVYARRALGWSPEEALGLRPHRDGRGLRSDVCWAGQPAASLRAVAAAQNIPLATLRSRLHRARRVAGADGANEVPDLARDRRKAGKATRSPPLALPHPHRSVRRAGYRGGVCPPHRTAARHGAAPLPRAGHPVRHGRAPLVPRPAAARAAATAAARDPAPPGAAGRARPARRGARADPSGAERRGAGRRAARAARLLGDPRPAAPPARLAAAG
ncbi:GIY-YIG nuclease family protein [Teichococcus vastitatis]|uniref:hypothetical protein n=1 Tax=Teichococcus vastitatis TaxID=2307076 RepID=UPI000E74DD24|nr:hypothetical protein [Pseudoroseomonas vastitatis]